MILQINGHLLKHLLLFAIVFVQFTYAHGQDGHLDSSFNTIGKLITTFTPPDVQVFTTTIQSDGKILVAGRLYVSTTYDFMITRYLPNGNVDSSFGNNGIVTTDIKEHDEIHGIAVLPDGKIVVAGTSYHPFGLITRFALARYLSDGTLDNTFGVSGIAIATPAPEFYDYTCLCMAVQTDGRIVVGGFMKDASQTFYVLHRYQSNGVLDTSFDTDGMVANLSKPNTAIHSVKIQPDGKILACGYQPDSLNTFQSAFLTRYNTNGTVDLTFGINGFAEFYQHFPNNEIAYDVDMQSDGKIITCVGHAGDFSAHYNYGFLMRFDTQGKIDTTYGYQGKAHFFKNGVAKSVCIQPDDKPIAVGYLDDLNDADYMLIRFKMNGEHDSTFGNNSFVQTSFSYIKDFSTASTLQSDGRIVCIGNVGNMFDSDKIGISRYHTGIVTNNSNYEKPNKNNLTIYPNPSHESFSILGLESNVLYTGKLFDILGNQKLTICFDIHRNVIHTSLLPKGQYYFVIQSKASSEVHPLQKR
jgi:uncharacterized delta-60 repeat protein